MNDPRRLIEEGSDLEVALLRAGRGENPPSEARGRTLARIGLAAGTFAATATAASAAAAASKGGGTILASALSLKALGALLVVSAVGVGTAQYVRSHRAPPRAVDTQQPVVATLPNATVQATPNPGAGALAPAQPATPPAVTADLAPTPTAPAAQIVAPAPTSAPAAAPSLKQELALLDAATASLRAGNAAQALQTLDEHQKTFHGGTMAAEATVLRIDALSRLGRTSEAKALADAFLTAHPDSPHAGRVRAIIGGGAKTNP